MGKAGKEEVMTLNQAYEEEGLLYGAGIAILYIIYYCLELRIFSIIFLKRVFLETTFFQLTCTVSQRIIDRFL